MDESIVFCSIYVYDVVVKKVHVRYLISWWVSCYIAFDKFDYLLQYCIVAVTTWTVTLGVIQTVGLIVRCTCRHAGLTWQLKQFDDLIFYLNSADETLLFVRFLANVNARSLYVVVRPSVCRLPCVCHESVCNVRAPYSSDWNFWQFFYEIWYVGHLWPFGKNFTEIVLAEPLRRGVKRKWVSQI